MNLQETFYLCGIIGFIIVTIALIAHVIKEYRLQKSWDLPPINTHDNIDGLKTDSFTINTDNFKNKLKYEILRDGKVILEPWDMRSAFLYIREQCDYEKIHPECFTISVIETNGSYILLRADEMYREAKE